MSKTFIVNRVQAAEFLGVTRDRVSQLVKHHGLPATNLRHEGGARDSFRFKVSDLKTFKAEHPELLIRRRHINGHGPQLNETSTDAPVVDNLLGRPTGMLTTILNELKALRQEVADLKALWS